MPLELQFPLSTLIRRRSNSNNYLNVKPWVRKAIAEQEPKPNDQLWRDEPSAEFQYNDRLRRIRFLRKHANNDSLIQRMADRLELCERNNRCCSGACPECGRLLQRWFVRKSKRLIRDVIDKADRQLVAITIIPAEPIIRPSNLHTLDAHNLKRRLIYALDKAEINIAIGAIDFSFNEDEKGKYNPFWSPHFYVITSIADETRVKKILKKRYLPSRRRIPRPINISPFKNSARRRSYAFKIQFKRRIGIVAFTRKKDGTKRKCRDTSPDKLRAAERLELFIYLDQIGFAERFIFRSVKPIIETTKIKLRGIDV